MLKKTTNNRKMLVLMVAGLGLAGCNSSLDIAKQKTPTADVFEKTLYQQYIILSQSEHDEYDRRDGTKFANRAIAAAIGSPSQPEALSARKIPIEFHGELLAARRQLVEALDAGGRQKAPEHAARAQAAFDCWLQEREENFQFDDIQNCQDQFDVAMDVMNAQLRPKKSLSLPRPHSKLRRPRRPAPNCQSNSRSISHLTVLNLIKQLWQPWQRRPKRQPVKNPWRLPSQVMRTAPAVRFII